MITTIIKDNKEILVLDYSDCKQEAMLDIVTEAKRLLLSGNKPRLLLSIFNDKAYATPKFMTAVRKITAEIIHLIDKQAIVGLNYPKKIILKGYNLLFNRNIRAFDTSEEAISYLIDDSTTDKDVPEHLR